MLVAQLALSWGTAEEAEARGFQGHCKDTRVTLGFSRDGFHWSRPEAPRARLFETPLRYEQPVAGNFVVSPDGKQLYVYQSGASYCKLCNVETPRARRAPTGMCRSGNSSGRTRRPAVSFEQTEMEEVTTISTLRRDGFCSLHAAGAEAEAHTRLLVLAAGPSDALFINAECRDGGWLEAALSDAQWWPLHGFERTRSARLVGDMYHTPLHWGRRMLPERSSSMLHISFYLRQCDLFSFWVGPSSAHAMDDGSV